MKKLVKLFCIAMTMVLAFSLCACKLTVEKPKREPDEVLHTNPNATKDITIKVLTQIDEYNTMVAWANEYMYDHEDVQLKVTNDLSSMNILATWGKKGVPDIMWTSGDQHTFWSANGYFSDLTQFLVGDDAGYFDDFYPSVLESTKFSNTDSGMWFMPRDYNQLVTVLNTEMFAEANIPLPNENWTWQDLEEICKKFREYNSVQKYYPLELKYSWSPLMLTLMNDFNAGIYKNSNLAINDAEMQAFMTYMNDFIHTKKYTGTGTGGFLGKLSPMVFSVRPEIPVYASQDISLKILPYPSMPSAANGKGYVGVGCSGYAMGNAISDEDKPIAWDFLKFCMSEEGYEIAGKKGTLVPARMSLANKGSWTQYKDSDGNTLDNKPFISSVAEPIGVNYFTALKPENHTKVMNAAQIFMNELNSSQFNFTEALKILNNSIGRLD